MKYEKPRMDIIYIEEEEILMASGGLNQREEGDGGSEDFNDLGSF